MTNTQIILNYIKPQKSIMFDEVTELGYTTVCYSKNDPSPFWNNAFVNFMLSDNQLNEIENKMASLNRSSAVYFENKSDLIGLKSFLEETGYAKTAEDSLMFYKSDKVKSEYFECVRKVETAVDLEVFLDTFNRSYLKDDPLNPYGELGEYLTAARIAWEKHHENNRIEYFIAYKNNKPVSVSTLTNYEQIGYISSVGSILSVRGEGYGKLATLYCVAQSNEEPCSKLTGYRE